MRKKDKEIIIKLIEGAMFPYGERSEGPNINYIMNQPWEPWQDIAEWKDLKQLLKRIRKTK